MRCHRLVKYSFYIPKRMQHEVLPDQTRSVGEPIRNDAEREFNSRRGVPTPLHPGSQCVLAACIPHPSRRSR